MVVSLVLGIIIILITVCLRLQLIYQITNIQLFNKLCVCVHILCRRFSSGTREKVLRWLFPKAELCPLLDSAGTIVQRCLVTHSTNSQSKVSSRALKLTDCTPLLRAKLRIKITLTLPHQTFKWKHVFNISILDQLPSKSRLDPHWCSLSVLTLNSCVCFRGSGCSAGSWWVRVSRRFEFCLSNTVRSTAAPSTCGWRPETWVTAAAPLFKLQTQMMLQNGNRAQITPQSCTSETTSDCCPLWPLPFRSVRGPSVLADGTVPRPRPEHHLWRLGLLTFSQEDGDRGQSSGMRCDKHIRCECFSSCRDIFRVHWPFCVVSPTNALQPPCLTVSTWASSENWNPLHTRLQGLRSEDL